MVKEGYAEVTYSLATVRTRTGSTISVARVAVDLSVVGEFRYACAPKWIAALAMLDA